MTVTRKAAKLVSRENGEKVFGRRKELAFGNKGRERDKTETAVGPLALSYRLELLELSYPNNRREC